MIKNLLELHRRYSSIWLMIELIVLLAFGWMVSWLNSPAGQALRQHPTEVSLVESGTPWELHPIAFQGDGPFGPRQRIAEFPEGVDWLNTKNSLRLSDLKGKLVLLDFWTYCCINCMHVLPTLKKAEEEFAKELLVVGVHTAKFETEKDTDNIRSAILRYEIKHPVLNDSAHTLWKQLGVGTWPTLVLIDPEGYAIWAHAGEIPYAELQTTLKKAVAFYKRKGTLDDRQVFFDLVELTAKPTPLRFPGKVISDTAGERLFISDSNHNRIVVTTSKGELLSTIGSGRIGAEDGALERASFNHPQGLAYRDEVLWVADTENHLIRRVDLQTKKVTTVAGTGKQTDSAWPNLNIDAPVPRKLTRVPLNTPLGSPWDLWIHADDIYIAMAGPHQIWKMDLEGKGISQYAGNGREDIVDGPLLPKRTYAEGSSSFAQPSGLSSDGQWLYVADSEGSSIRAVPLVGNEPVRTVVGTSRLPQNRLFTFGDVDGAKADALLQHPLGVAYHSGQIYVVDTYNNKLKAVDAKTGAVKTVAGDGQPGDTDLPARLDEPGGLCVSNNRLYIADTNNHAIRVFDLSKQEMTTLVIDGLTPPKPMLRPEELKLPEGARRTKLPTQTIGNGLESVEVTIALDISEGWKLNELADFPVTVIQPGFADKNFRTAVKVEDNRLKFSLPLPATDKQTLQIAIGYYYCQADEQGLCLADSVVLDVPLERSGSLDKAAITLTHAIEPE